jgi:hypothetical protein
VVVEITVLDETVDVVGVTTRVVEERETANGVLAEISRSFFAICERTNTVVYFGEHVDNYDDTGTVVLNHDGAWRAGVGGALPGVIMPGSALLGARYFQEIAPEVTLDREPRSRASTSPSRRRRERSRRASSPRKPHRSSGDRCRSRRMHPAWDWSGTTTCSSPRRASSASDASAHFFRCFQRS